LKNVYFISGTPCGGKTTVSRALGKKYGIPVYDIDERFEEHQRMSDPASQPAMNKNFKNADEFFGRSVEEYKEWLLQNTREQLDFILLDLMRLSQNEKIICDCHLRLDQAAAFTDPSRMAFMIKKPENLVDEYCNRQDHQGFSDFIHSATDFEKAKETCNATLLSLNEKFYEDVKASEYFWLERDNARSVDETAALVAKHFGFETKNLGLEAEEAKNPAAQADGAVIQIVRVTKDTALADDFLHFVENCSWTEVREHIAGLIRGWEFTDWETMFAAVVDGKIVGMTSLLKTDYYPLPEIFPWVSCVFVEKEYRGNRISEKLIAAANEYAKSLGFVKTYIPTEFTGFYEKYGYSYVKDIVNYGGGTDRLYVTTP
jgi:GNAT superfamily N-acetyltransferase/adenylate kinase family enzyme